MGSAVEVFLFVVVALVGTLAFFADPIGKLMSMMDGKTVNQLTKETEAWLEGVSLESIVGKGCGFVLFLLLSASYTLIVEPLAVIYAIVNKVGYQPLAYAMGCVVVLEWIVSALIIRKRQKADKAKKATVVTKDGERVEGTVEVDLDAEIKLPHQFIYTVRRVFFSLPTFYLWYLFVVLVVG